MSINLLLQRVGVNTFRKEGGAHVFFKRLFVAASDALSLIFYSPHYLPAMTQSVIKHELSDYSWGEKANCNPSCIREKLLGQTSSDWIWIVWEEMTMQLRKQMSATIKASMNKNRKEWTVNLVWGLLWPRTKENPPQCSVLFSNLVEMPVMLSQGRDDRCNNEDTVERIMQIEDQTNTIQNQ